MLEPSDMTTLYCTQCSYAALLPFQLEHHTQKKHRSLHATEPFETTVEPEQHPCIRCDFYSYYKLARYEHLKNKHNGSRTFQDEYISQFTEEFAVYSCSYCNYNGHSILSFAKHSCEIVSKAPITADASLSSTAVMKINTEPFSTNDLLCSHCLFKAKSKSGFKRHLRMKHGLAQEEEWFSCPDCSHLTKRRENLKRHMMTHAKPEDISWFHCATCSFRSKDKRSVLRHALVTHAVDDQVEWFYCTECSYRAKQKFYVQRHMTIHTTPVEELTWFSCTECSYRAKYRRSLKLHMLTHAPDDVIDWFDCPECPFRAKQKLYLQRHMLTHASADQIQWFNCAECSYRTKHKRNLKLHMMTHTADDKIDWFNCPKCSYRAKQKGTLKTHLLTHATGDDIEWFDCSACDYRTKLKKNLKKHNKRKHALLERSHRAENKAKPAIRNRIIKRQMKTPEAVGETGMAQAEEDGLALMHDAVNAIYGILTDNST